MPIGGFNSMDPNSEPCISTSTSEGPDCPNHNPFMHMDNILKYGGLVLIAFLIYWFKLRLRVPKGYKLPPGPPRRFLIGNLLDFPRQKEWETYSKWSKIYGDLIYLNICGTPILLVNSQSLTSELFVQRGAIYSDRFQSTMLSDLVDIASTVMLQPDEKWKRHRSMFHRCFGKAALTQYRGLLEKSAKNLLRQLYETPERFIEHSRHALGAFTMEATYGIETLPEDDPYIEVAERAMATLVEVARPGAYLVDIFPVLKYLPSWIPGTGFKKKAEQLKAEMQEMSDVPFAVVQNAIKGGKASSSIIGTFLEEQASGISKEPEDEQLIREVGVTIYLGAIDTTESAIKVFLMAMLLYPDAQRKAQKELDSLIGDSALPSIDHRKNLPYTDALCKEVLRWRPSAPLGFPHLLKEDDIIGEYFIPKGTIVVGNSWSLLHSKLAYGDDADKFNPERFLKHGVSYPDIAFGFGRRVCPGRYLADVLLFTIAASILHTFHIVPYEEELPDPDAFISGMIIHPKPFKCKFIPRSSQSITLLEQLSMTQ